MTKLPREIHNALAKAQTDLEWAVRMMHESVTPDAVDIERLVEEIAVALRNAKAARLASRSVPVQEMGKPDA